MEHKVSASFLAPPTATRLTVADVRAGDLVEFESAAVARVETYLVLKQWVTSSIIAGVTTIAIEWTHFSLESDPKTYTVKFGPLTPLTLLSRPNG